MGIPRCCGSFVRRGGVGHRHTEVAMSRLASAVTSGHSTVIPSMSGFGCPMVSCPRFRRGGCVGNHLRGTTGNVFRSRHGSPRVGRLYFELIKCTMSLEGVCRRARGVGLCSGLVGLSLGRCGHVIGICCGTMRERLVLGKGNCHLRSGLN